jgi:putative CRISPR-associated protein (TIGR02620 family)
MSAPLIVTRHAGIVAWLAGRGITGDVVSHATPEVVAGRDVVGILPLNLCSMALSITTIDLLGLRPDQRGQELTPAEMDAAGATLRRYIVMASNGV